MITCSIISILIAVLRVAGMTNSFYQAAAHLFVGALIGAYWVQPEKPRPWPMNELSWRLYFVIALSVVEVGAFLWFRFAGA